MVLQNTYTLVQHYCVITQKTSNGILEGFFLKGPVMSTLAIHQKNVGTKVNATTALFMIPQKINPLCYWHELYIIYLNIIHGSKSAGYISILTITQFLPM